MLIGAAAVVPLTVMALETCTLVGSTFMSGVKLNAFGAVFTPVPDRGTTVVITGEAAAVLMMVRVPFRLPRAVGVKVTVTVQAAWPAAMRGNCWSVKSPPTPQCC